MPDDPPIIDVAPPTWPPLLMSLVFHVIVLTLIGLLLKQNPSGTGDAADRPVGIAIVHRLPDRDRYAEPAEAQPVVQPQTSEQASSSSTLAAPPVDLSPPIDLSGVLRSMESTPSPGSATGITGETNLDGDALGSGNGKASSGDSGTATTMVFGVSGSGSRFVYVFDRSDSMNGFGGKPLRAAKAELIRSLRTLTDKQRFQLIFYNDKPTPFRMSGMPVQMMTGDAPSVTSAEHYVNAITAFGGTEHETALKMALRLAPDVIFFLTDARIPRLNSAELRDIQVRAEQAGTTIHAIEFGTDSVAPLDSFLRDLAAMNHGQYQYVDLRQLKAGSP